jgi:hypothetical protein
MARHETGTCVVEVLRSGDAAVLDAHGGAFVPAGERAAVAGWLLDEGDDALIERLAAAAWDANRVNGVRCDLPAFGARRGAGAAGGGGVSRRPLRCPHCRVTLAWQRPGGTIRLAEGATCADAADRPGTVVVRCPACKRTATLAGRRVALVPA